ncbi:MAG TPA: glycosyltransferase family 2 protein [Ramlibacter sp.]|uniref:glycosyltransferase family 2 protein n=1 Tax=Ramlibacter sp. TaxID=1917967 RepID=UPI002BCAE3A2|nr:glycosyltransferase family 2 protein [Ramlibacter sp.]HVZ42284.1 glycosyltransferase family 2 protein [Ramlibacter sp.]
MAEVAVVIVNYNGGRWLDQCLRALQAQTFTDFVALVVDNGSVDGSAALVSRMNDARFRLVEAGRNLGFAAASNLGARQAARTPFIALLNPDAFPEVAWLEALLDAARANPRAAAFDSTLIDAAHPELCDGTGDLYHFTGRARRRDHGRPLALGEARPEAPVFAACAAAALYRREAWVEACGLDEDFFCYMEDVDLAFRLRLNGWECMHVPAARCRHVGSATTGVRSDFSVYQGQRNLVWVFVKNMPPPLFGLLLPLHVVLNAGALVVLLARGQGAVGWRAKRDALRGLGKAWAKRRAIQAKRRVGARAIWARLDRRLWPGS